MDWGILYVIAIIDFHYINAVALVLGAERVRAQ